MECMFIDRMERAIAERARGQRPGLYRALLLPIGMAFLATFVGARICNHFFPTTYLMIDGIHVHHFAPGIFFLMTAGYLSLIFDGPRAKFFVALLFGFAMGLIFDEFSMWIMLNDADE